jgi:hypothetical protein
MISVPFMLEEVKKVSSKTIINKAAGFDGIYLKFIKHASPRVCEWLARFFSDILDTANIP